MQPTVGPQLRKRGSTARNRREGGRHKSASRSKKDEVSTHAWLSFSAQPELFAFVAHPSSTQGPHSHGVLLLDLQPQVVPPRRAHAKVLHAAHKAPRTHRRADTRRHASQPLSCAPRLSSAQIEQRTRFLKCAAKSSHDIQKAPSSRASKSTARATWAQRERHSLEPSARHATAGALEVLLPYACLPHLGVLLPQRALVAPRALHAKQTQGRVWVGRKPEAAGSSPHDARCPHLAHRRTCHSKVPQGLRSRSSLMLSTCLTPTTV